MCGVMSIGYICTQMQLCYYRFAEPSLVDLSLSLSPCDLPFQSPCDSLRLSFPLIVSGHSPVEMRGSNLKTSSVGQKWESPTVSFRSFRELLLFCSFFFFLFLLLSNTAAMQEEYFYWIYNLKSPYCMIVKRGEIGLLSMKLSRCCKEWQWCPFRTMLPALRL